MEKCVVVFVSNKKRVVPLWRQKAGREEEKLVIWDYHVILLYKPDHRTLGNQSFLTFFHFNFFPEFLIIIIIKNKEVHNLWREAKYSQLNLWCLKHGYCAFFLQTWKVANYLGRGGLIYLGLLFFQIFGGRGGIFLKEKLSFLYSLWFGLRTTFSNIFSQGKIGCKKFINIFFMKRVLFY